MPSNGVICLGKGKGSSGSKDHQRHGGWGSGAQHSQCIPGSADECPGLGIVAPATPYDAKRINGDRPTIMYDNKSDDVCVCVKSMVAHNKHGNDP